jgi:hypothetical protein
MAFLRAVAAGFVLLTAASSIDAAQLYWIDAGGIHRANLDGSAQQLVIPATGVGVSSMAADTTNDWLYWIMEDNPAQIRRGKLNGSDPHDFLTVDEASGGIFVHPTTHDVWWGGSKGTDNNSVFRTSADGVTTTMAFKPVDGDLNDFFIDGNTDKLYNLDTDDDGVRRMNLDGTALEGVGGGNVMAVVPSEGKIYYGNRRSNLDGSGQEVLFESSVMPTYRAYAVDPLTSTMFMGEYSGTIYRINIDGSNLQPIITGPGPIAKMMLVELVPEPSTLTMLLAALPLAYLAYRRRRSFA